LHPIFGVDAYEAKQFAPDDYVLRDGPFRTLDEDREFLDAMRRGVAKKRNLSSAILAEDDWDLFITVFGESHGIGHQQWHLHDQTHPRFDRAVRDALGGDPILQLYRDIDGALGELLEHVGDAATVLVLLSHGMGPHLGAVHLLDEVLARFDQFNRREMGIGKMSRALRQGLRSLPRPMQRRVTAFAVPAIRRRAASRNLVSCREFVSAEERAKQQYFLEPNNFVYGGIRLNLMGREPRGCVSPDQVDDVIAELTKDLLSLVELGSGRPVARSVERTHRWHSRSPTDTLPDLFVEFENVLAETVWSPKTGIVHGAYTNWRSGDHLPDGLLVARGPGIGSKVAKAIQIEDFAPSIAARLGVKLDDIDGRAVSWLAGHA
jgi:predicted AlkP superfamily phosphohydrolase/phosphomutase